MLDFLEEDNGAEDPPGGTRPGDGGSAGLWDVHYGAELGRRRQVARDGLAAHEGGGGKGAERGVDEAFDLSAAAQRGGEERGQWVDGEPGCAGKSEGWRGERGWCCFWEVGEGRAEAWWRGRLGFEVVILTTRFWLHKAFYGLKSTHANLIHINIFRGLCIWVSGSMAMKWH